MKKYAIIINEETKELSIGIGTNSAFYQSIGMVEMEVELGYDEKWYIKGYAPVKPEPTKEEISTLREQAYIQEVDKITCHINRLKDEEQTTEVIDEIASLVEERKAKVEEIKARFPYPEETLTEPSSSNIIETSETDINSILGE